MDVQLHTGNCLHILKTLPAQSVQTCVTSPPYFGLRDYQTATWEGGDPECDHEPDEDWIVRSFFGNSSNQFRADGTPKITTQRNAARAVWMKQTPGKCPRCGARRVDAQIGLEETPDQYVAKLVAVFREVRRVLRDDGTVWLNLGDSMLPNKCEAMIPHRVAMALMEDGWICRSTIIWHKPNPMPESVTDRPTKAHEYIFLLSKQARYFYDADAVREPHETATTDKRYQITPEEYYAKRAAVDNDKIRGDMATGRLKKGWNPMANPLGRNRRTVWTVTPKPFKGAHFATYPPDLIEPCILAGSKPGDTVLDPFAGSGTTGYVALTLGRRFVGIELNPDYMRLIEQRLSQAQLPLLEAI
jgi:DNA modification methylase